MEKPKRLRTTTVRFAPGQTRWLTKTAAEIVQPSGVPMDRSRLLRALIDGVSTSGLDLSLCLTEDEVKRIVAATIADGLLQTTNGVKTLQGKGKTRA